MQDAQGTGGPVVLQMGVQDALELAGQVGVGLAALQLGKLHAPEVVEGEDGFGADAGGAGLGRTVRAGDLALGRGEPALSGGALAVVALAEVGAVAELVEQVQLDPAAQQARITVVLEGSESLEQEPKRVGGGLLEGKADAEQLEQVAGVGQAVELGPQAGKGLERTGLGERIEGLAPGELGMQMGGGLEQADQGAAGLARALGDGVELALVGGEAGDDLVGLAEGTALEDQQLGAVKTTQ